MILSRFTEALGALTAIAGLAAISALPLEHVHKRADGDGHHPVVVHRHFEGHHAGVAASPHAIPLGPRCGDDDHNHAETLRVFFTAATRVEVPRLTWAAVKSDLGIALAPPLAVGESFVPPRRLYTSPADTPPALRGPPASS